MATEKTTIKLCELCVGYGETEVLHELDLSLRQGTWTVLLGPNGSGKTTLLKTLMGQIEPFSGRALITDKDCYDYNTLLKKTVGYLPEEMYLYPNLTAIQMLNFAGDMHCIPVKEMKRRINELLGIFKLNEHRDRIIKNYSMGMKRKLGICLALIHKPKILLLDEPMNGLDPEAAEIARGILKEQCEANLMTILMSTHNMGMLHQYCDDLLIFSGGRILVESTPEELKQRYPEKTLEEIFLETVKNSNCSPLIHTDRH